MGHVRVHSPGKITFAEMRAAVDAAKYWSNELVSSITTLSIALQHREAVAAGEGLTHAYW
jgi:hypothetical protein